MAAASNVLTRWLCQVHCVPLALKDFGLGGGGGGARRTKKKVTSFRISGYLACGSLASCACLCVCVRVYRVDEFPLSCSWFLGFYGEFVGQLPHYCNPFATKPLCYLHYLTAPTASCQGLELFERVFLPRSLQMPSPRLIFLRLNVLTTEPR